MEESRNDKIVEQVSNSKGQKLCPVSTIGKDGAHFCVDLACAWWNNEARKCGVLAISDGLIILSSMIHAISFDEDPLKKKDKDEDKTES